MTNDEKAKAYDEALKQAKKELATCGSMDCDAARQIFRFFPDLRESEDERIRNCLRCLTSLDQAQDVIADMGFTRQDLLSYLEKRKENPKNADSIPADCASLAKCEDRDSKYGVFPEDVIVVARACEKLEAHGYSELAHALKNVNLYTKPVDYDHEMWKNCEANFEGGKKEVIDHPERYGLQKEQKLLPGFDDLTPEEKMNHPLYLEGFDAGREVGKVEAEQKPAEWSEEDEEHRESILKRLDGMCKHGATFTQTRFAVSEDMDWLNHRPSWKPSEEDIKMLEHIIGQYETGNKNSKVMGYLPRVEELNFLEKVLAKWKN